MKTTAVWIFNEGDLVFFRRTMWKTKELSGQWTLFVVKYFSTEKGWNTFFSFFWQKWSYISGKSMFYAYPMFWLCFLNPWKWHFVSKLILSYLNLKNALNREHSNCSKSKTAWPNFMIPKVFIFFCQDLFKNAKKHWKFCFQNFGLTCLVLVLLGLD